MVVVAVIAVLMLAAAAVLIVSAVIEPRARRSDHLAQIGEYGYAGRPEGRAPGAPRSGRKTLDQLASTLGDLVGGHMLRTREAEIQHELISAGFFNIGARRFLGYRVLAAVLLHRSFLSLLALHALMGASGLGLFLIAVFAALLGWVGPNIVVHRRARQRLQLIDEGLPGLIDLLVVTLEAGVAFTARPSGSASERLTGPLGDEIRLTIQEQSLGLSTLEALENWLKRCDTMSVRAFVRAMVQGDKLGVSIGMILRQPGRRDPCPAEGDDRGARSGRRRSRSCSRSSS